MDIPLSKIPLGSHGNTPTQKRLWRVTSDLVRIKDFMKYGKCVSCDKRFYSWEESQGGHYKAYAVCRGYTKFNTKNIFGQCKYCNGSFSGHEVGKRFYDEIVRRHGKKRIAEINTYNTIPIEKVEDSVCEKMIYQRIKEIKKLDYQPEYLL